MPGTEVGSGDENISGSVSISSGTVNVGNFPAVQPVDDNGGSLTVDDGGGSLTVDGTVAVSNFPATQPISAATLPLPTGAATAALQTAGNASLATIDAGIPAALGPALMAASMPVTIASNQTPVPISGTVTITDGAGPVTVDGTVAVSNFPATQPISAAALPLPAGAATAANQATEITSLASIDAGIPAALGTAAGAASMPVTLATDQPLDDTFLVFNDLGSGNTRFVRRYRTTPAGTVTVADFTLAGGAYVLVGPVQPVGSGRNVASIIVTLVSGVAGTRTTSALARRVTMMIANTPAAIGSRPTINAVSILDTANDLVIVLGDLSTPDFVAATTIATHTGAGEVLVIEEL